MAGLYRELEKYRDMDFYPFHMPGHKRCREAADGALAEIYGLDITEIDGFDNLHQAKGILRDEQEKAAKLYGSAQCYYLVNGSTCGVLSAVFAVTERGGRILMARNCHKSVYHAVYLRELEAAYLQPGIFDGGDGLDYGIAGRIEPEAVERALCEIPDCAAVVITSPTYEGVVSDVEKIAHIAHSHGIPLIVDEAHGAHFGFHEAYPAGSVRLGADLVIHSVHKTLPSMTQSALLHWNGNEEDRVDRGKLERYLRIFQTSSPSYVLMASVSHCMEFMEREGREQLDRLLEYRRAFEKQVKGCRYIKILGESGGYTSGWYDPCKLVIGIKGGRMTGQELYDTLLQRYHIQPEMASEYYALAIATMMDTRDGWNRLAGALMEIDAGLSESGAAGKRPVDREQTRDRRNFWQCHGLWKPEPVMTIAEAYEARWEVVPLSASSGRIAAEFIHLYPPGVPFAAPGERLTEDMVEMLLRYERLRLGIQGVENGLVKVIRI